MNNIFENAVYYATALNWRVLPVAVRGKNPIIKNWTEKASNDVIAVSEMFKHHTGNIGVACGAGSGIVVIDIDLPDGMNTLKQLEATLGCLPPTLTQATGSGGTHLLSHFGRVKTPSFSWQL